jgi:hypothetical protein
MLISEVQLILLWVAGAYTQNLNPRSYHERSVKLTTPIQFALSRECIHM